MVNLNESTKFMYSNYLALLSGLGKAGYSLIPFCEARNVAGPRAIIRHDIDLSPDKALYMAEIEQTAGVSSTYFVMVSSSWYNLFDRKNERCIRSILDMGHEVGLHFDAAKYGIIDKYVLQDAVLREMDLLNRIIDRKAISISWHIPDKEFIGTRLDFLEQRGYMNAYDPEFFFGYKYLSDSSMNWRECPEQFMNVKEYPKIQILTHPIWYSDQSGIDGDAIMLSALEEREADCVSYIEEIFPGFKKPHQ